MSALTHIANDTAAPPPARRGPQVRPVPPARCPGLLWLGVFFIVPMIFLFSQSLQTGSLEDGYTLTWNWATYSDAISLYSEQFIRSFVYAGTATALALLIGYPLAYCDRLQVRPVEERPAGAGHRAVLHQLPAPHAGLADHPVRARARSYDFLSLDAHHRPAAEGSA